MPPMHSKKECSMNNTGFCGIFVIMYYLLSAAAAYFTVASADMMNIKMNTPEFKALVPCISAAVSGGIVLLIYFLSGRFKSFCRTNFTKTKVSVFVKLVPVSAAVWLCGMFLNTVINAVVYHFFYISAAQQIASTSLKSVRLINFMYVCVIAPVFEELFFRGVLYDDSKTHGIQIAVLISALMFAIAHSSITVFGLPLVMGIVSALTLAKTGNVFYCIFIHALCNGASFVVSVLPQSPKIVMAENLFILICGALIFAAVLIINHTKIAKFLKSAVLQIPKYFSSSSEIIAFVSILLYYIYSNYCIHFI